MHEDYSLDFGQILPVHILVRSDALKKVFSNVASLDARTWRMPGFANFAGASTPWAKIDKTR